MVSLCDESVLIVNSPKYGPVPFRIDAACEAAVASRHWGVMRTKTGLMYATTNYSAICLHRFLLSPVPPGIEVDHINGDTLDNRMRNLRLASKSENGLNRHRPNKNSKSGYLGISPNRDGWSARVQRDRRTIHLGTFRTKEEAAAVAAAERVRILSTVGALQA